MTTIKRTALSLLSGFVAALAMLPATAHAVGAEARAANEALTSQSNQQTQQGAGSGCSGCAGRAQTQLSLELSTTVQQAEAEAQAEQSARQPVSELAESNNAASRAANSATTNQRNYQSQDGAGSSCSLDCGATGRAQVSTQSSTTTQMARADAVAKQDVTDAKLPVAGASHDRRTAPNESADRAASNSAEARAANEALTSQSNQQMQQGVGSSCSGCEGRAQTQLSLEESTTVQQAEAEAQAEQTATQPVSELAKSNAASRASNSATTKQRNYQSEDGASASCSLDCGATVRAQVSTQTATTTQMASSDAQASQDVTDHPGPCCGCGSSSSCPSSGGGDAPSPSGSGGEANAAAEADATVQLIWQVQLPQCVVHCSGTAQSQTAEQRNSTVQTLDRAAQVGGSLVAETTRNDVRSEQSLTQIQLGCVSHCFGATTTTPAPTLAGYAQAVRAVVQVLRGIGGEVSKLIATPALEQNTVEQISYQSQRDPGGLAVQAESASQVATTVQEYDLSPLTTGLQEALEPSAAPRAQAVNQTEQAIWQLQVGCLMFCSATQLNQQAVQSNSTGQDAAALQAEPNAASSSASHSTQLVWQAQIGCLFWCFDATEQQTAAGPDTPTVGERSGTPVRAPADPPARPPAASADPSFPSEVIDELAYVEELARELRDPEAAAIPTDGGLPSMPPTAANLGSGGAGVSLLSSATGTAPPPSPAPALPLGISPPAALSRAHSGWASTAFTVHSATAGAAGHLRTPRPLRLEARTTGGLGHYRASPRVAVVAPRTDVRRSSAGVASSAGIAEVAHARAAAGAAIGDVAPGASANAASGIPLATLLSGFALCGLCVFGVALATARRDPRGGEPETGG